MQSEAQGAQRTYTGERLAEVAFPLGGIGTGTVSLGGRGNLQDWEIFNRPAKGRSLPYSFFALWARPEGGPAVARVLERKLLPPFVREHGLPPAQAAGLPRLDEVRFSGEYPFAYLEFEDAALPLRVSLEAFNPMAPLDADVSGLPVAIFRWRLRNPGPRPVQATIALSLCNAVGYDGVAPLGTQPRHPGFGGNLNAWREEGTVRGLAMSARRPAAGAPDAGGGIAGHRHHLAGRDLPGAVGARRVVRTPCSPSGTTSARTGFCPASRPPTPPRTGLTDVGTVGLRATLPAGGEATLPFVLAWHFPELTNYWNRPGRGLAASSRVPGTRLGNYYTTRHADAWAVAQEVAGALEGLRARTLAFKGALFDSTLPAEVLDAVSSQMSIIRTTTCLRTADGAFHAFEGCDDNAGCCPMDCTHVWNYEQALAHLYPALERSMRETDFRVNTRPTGRMSFRTLLPVVSGELWDYKPAADGQMGCVLKLYREWQLSGDTEWLRALWPQAKRAIEWAWAPGSWDADGDGVMEGEQHNTYDIEFFGPNTMSGTLYLGALKAAAVMGEALGDGSGRGALPPGVRGRTRPATTRSSGTASTSNSGWRCARPPATRAAARSGTPARSSRARRSRATSTARAASPISCWGSGSPTWRGWATCCPRRGCSRRSAPSCATTGAPTSPPTSPASAPTP